MDIYSAVTVYLHSKKAENVSARTITTYKEALDKLTSFLETKKVVDISDVTPTVVRHFIHSLQCNVKNITVHRYYRTIRTFFLFLHNEEYMDHYAMQNLKAPKVEKKQARTFDKNEIRQLLNCWNQDNFFGLRNYTIMAMFFSTGIRKTELMNLKLVDVNITNDLIRISHGKGNKERFVPVGKSMRRILLRYMKARSEFMGDDNCQFLFPTNKKTCMTASCLSVLFQKIKKELNLNGDRISCHTWRHTMAKNYLLNGGDIFSLQNILGHSDIATTRVYLNMNENELKMQHAKFNPLDNKDWMI